MKTISIFVFICVSLCAGAMPIKAQTTTSDVSSTPHTDQELLGKIQSRDNSDARQAIKIARATKRLNILVAGIKSPDHDVRVESLEALNDFKPSERKSAILVVLNDDHLWKRESSGDEATAQTVYLRRLTQALKTLGIDAQSEDFLAPTKRTGIAAKLAAASTAE
jgi:hypothetical protein